ncbi:MAG: hypothetical protein EX271_11815 [Acidimicrobiales bacterium]|nr:hypothetical protein [Hyphomonadaceae bacterium]RZV37047.1 MAG: hypothetical protein EX271_11815 [Acidimicrobiales bacterium]
MNYSTKMMISKTLVTAAIALYAALPFFTKWEWMSVGNLLAFPVFLYALWGGLHGTARSVRLVAFLVMAYILGYFISLNWLSDRPPLEYLPYFAAVFGLLTLGVLFSIKRK